MFFSKKAPYQRGGCLLIALLRRKKINEELANLGQYEWSNYSQKNGVGALEQKTAARFGMEFFFIIFSRFLQCEHYFYCTYRLQ